MLLVSYVTGMLFAVASAFSSSYVMFAVLRFLTGFCITGIVIVSSVLSKFVSALHLNISPQDSELEKVKINNKGFSLLEVFVLHRFGVGGC